MESNGFLRIAAVGDIHCSVSSKGKFREFFKKMSDEADIALLVGDLVDYGMPEETEIFAEELMAGLKIPALGVLGNHEYESGKEGLVIEILAQAGLKILDGTSTVVEGIGFAGVKGFCGGFAGRTLAPWGEKSIKAFVKEAEHEVTKLDESLSQLTTDHKVVLLHYSPIRETVEGEPLEIFPFLGSSRLEAPLNKHKVSVAFHGHAHHGSLVGCTSTAVPVYNVAMPLLRRMCPDRPPFRITRLKPGFPYLHKEE